MMKLPLLCALGAALVLSGCATYQSPVPAKSTAACWNDLEYQTVNENPEGLTEYRACLSSKTEFGTPPKVQTKLERRAVKFCAQTRSHYRLLSVGSQPAVKNSEEIKERSARVELVFVCTKDLNAATIINPKTQKRLDMGLPAE